ncbi:MAG: PQQ-binding-like beta-propeller repeat protein [Planctomycetota bacterium]
MKKLAALGLVALILVGSPLSAKDRRKRGPAIAVDPAVAKIVAPLIEKLDSKSFEERESATRALKALGPTAAPALSGALGHPSLEVRARVSRILLHYREMQRLERMGTPVRGDWPMLRRSPGRVAGEGEALRTLPDLLWRCPLPGRVGKWFDCPLLVVEKHVVTVGRDGRVTCIKRETGEIAWSRETKQAVFAGPVMAAGVIYVPGPSLLALDARTGKTLWTWKTDYGVVASPLVAQGRVIAVEKGERIVALHPANGSQIWRRRISATRSSPVICGDLVVVGARDGLRAFRIKDGQRRWTVETRGPVSAPPVALPDRVIFCDDNGGLRAVSVDRGKVLWTRRFPEGGVAGVPAVYGDAIYFSTLGATFRAIRAGDGGDLWTRWIGSLNASSPCIVDGTIYLTGGSLLFALECADGDDVWRGLLEEKTNWSAPILIDGTLYLLEMNGVLEAHRADLK